MDRILPSEIAVVVQGPIFGSPGEPMEKRITQQGLASVRRHLPGAEIILSTWEGAEVRELEFDRLILSPDPGPAMFQETSGQSARATNVNRMIVSSLAGLKAAEQPFVLKTRSDLWLSNARFLHYFGRYQERVAAAQVFAERILVHSRYTRCPDRCGRYGLLFHVSDCVQFGRRADLLTLWDQPLVGRNRGGVEMPTTLLNEQYVWTECLRHFMEVPMTQWSQTSLELHELAELALVNNFVVLGQREFGVASRKLHFDFRNWVTTYSYQEWQQLYALLILKKRLVAAHPSVSLKRLAQGIRLWPRIFDGLTRAVDKASSLFG